MSVTIFDCFWYLSSAYPYSELISIPVFCERPSSGDVFHFVKPQPQLALVDQVWLDQQHIRHRYFNLPETSGRLLFLVEIF